MSGSVRNRVSRPLLSAALLTAVALVSVPAHAAIDITAATAGITDAGTAVLALVTALIALSASIFGIVKVQRFISKRAGG